MTRREKLLLWQKQKEQQADGLVGPAQRALAARRRPLNRVSAKEMLGVVAKAAPKVSGAGKRAAAVQQKNRSTKLRRQSPTSAGIARPACGAKQQGLTNARAVTASKSSPDGGAKAANARMLQVLQPRPQPGGSAGEDDLFVNPCAASGAPASAPSSTAAAMDEEKETVFCNPCVRVSPPGARASKDDTDGGFCAPSGNVLQMAVEGAEQGTLHSQQAAPVSDDEEMHNPCAVLPQPAADVQPQPAPSAPAAGEVFGSAASSGKVPDIAVAASAAAADDAGWAVSTVIDGERTPRSPAGRTDPFSMPPPRQEAGRPAPKPAAAAAAAAASRDDTGRVEAKAASVQTTGLLSFAGHGSMLTPSLLQTEEVQPQPFVYPKASSPANVYRAPAAHAPPACMTTQTDAPTAVECSAAQTDAVGVTTMETQTDAHIPVAMDCASVQTDSVEAVMMATQTEEEQQQEEKEQEEAEPIRVAVAVTTCGSETMTDEETDGPPTTIGNCTPVPGAAGPGLDPAIDFHDERADSNPRRRSSGQKQAASAHLTLDMPAALCSGGGGGGGNGTAEAAAAAAAVAAAEAVSNELRGQVTNLEFANEILTQQVAEAKRSLARHDSHSSKQLQQATAAHAQEVAKWKSMMDSTVSTVQAQMKQVMEGSQKKIARLEARLAAANKAAAAAAAAQAVVLAPVAVPAAEKQQEKRVSTGGGRTPTPA
eukprot:COSAG05_NODE_1184_length_5590_cov_57.730468_5_plen_709_part_00